MVECLIVRGIELPDQLKDEAGILMEDVVALVLDL